MRILRSWPRVVPEGRVGVDDTLEKLVMEDYDYSPLGAVDDDVLLLEWDMLPMQDELHAFMRAATQQQRLLRVAPYPLYHVDSPGPVWCHRRITQTGERWIQWQEPTCDLFSFGLIWLPRDLVRAFLAAPAPARGRDPRLLPSQGYTDTRFTDQTFSIWCHFHHQGPAVPVEWDIRPVHLHR